MPENEEKVSLTPQELADILSNTVEKTISAAQNKTGDEWKLASQPFQKKSEGEQQAEKYSALISRPKATTEAKKNMAFFQTGTFLDNLFLTEEGKPANGIPIVCQLGLTGLAGCGKSILVQEIALRVANRGDKVIFVTSEDIWSSSSPRNDLQSRMKQKADTMGLNWETIRRNLFVLDAIQNSTLRDWETFVETLKYIVEILQGVNLLILDSITLMQSHRGSLKYRVMELSRYCQIRGITSIYVCQRAEDEADKLNVAGGIGLSHNLDIMMCVDKKKAASQLKFDLNQARPKDEQLKQWTECHFTRVMACRLCSHEGRYKEIFVNKNGFLKLIEYNPKT